ncbi:hypothetical protein LCGC14_0758290 [marine sediment metagenome]|uniref:Uncharacterized protein n=1 Tax=marine sediment metagenome TaxID=412755 RepID=A0A0F9QLR8_9ZZZZ
MIKGDYDWLDGIRLNNLCADHKTPLVIAWHAVADSWVLRCAEDHYPDAMVRDLSLTERYKAGEEFPEPIRSNIIKGQRRREMTQQSHSKAIALDGVPGYDLGNKALLTQEQVKALVAYALRYDLDPYRGHVVLYHGKPYITIDGYLYHAAKIGGAFQLYSRPLFLEERTTFLIPDKAHAWTAEVRSNDGKRSFTGMGIVTNDEMTEESKKTPGQLRSPVVARYPWQLAQKRAEWQALRRAFPIGLTAEEREEVPDDRP